MYDDELIVKRESEINDGSALHHVLEFEYEDTIVEVDEETLTHYDLSVDDINFLAHYGVKGMKWGVINEEEPVGNSSSSGISDKIKSITSKVKNLVSDISSKLPMSKKKKAEAEQKRQAEIQAEKWQGVSEQAQQDFEQQKVAEADSDRSKAEAEAQARADFRNNIIEQQQQAKAIKRAELLQEAKEQQKEKLFQEQIDKQSSTKNKVSDRLNEAMADENDIDAQEKAQRYETIKNMQTSAQQKQMQDAANKGNTPEFSENEKEAAEKFQQEAAAKSITINAGSQKANIDKNQNSATADKGLPEDEENYVNQYLNEKGEGKGDVDIRTQAEAEQKRQAEIQAEKWQGTTEQAQKDFEQQKESTTTKQKEYSQEELSNLFNQAEEALDKAFEKYPNSKSMADLPKPSYSKDSQPISESKQKEVDNYYYKDGYLTEEAKEVIKDFAKKNNVGILQTNESSNGNTYYIESIEDDLKGKTDKDDLEEIMSYIEWSLGTVGINSLNQYMYDNIKSAKHSEDFDDYLAHWGILGMKWGVRRFQKEDGSLTDEGKIRYGIDAEDKNNRKLVDRIAAEEDKRELEVVNNSSKLFNQAAGVIPNKKGSIQNKYRTTYKKEKYSDIGTEELRKRINTLQTEDQYANLVGDNKYVKSGEEKARETLQTVGSLIAIGGTVISIANTVRNFKEGRGFAEPEKKN